MYVRMYGLFMILCESLDDLYSTILSSDIISIDEKALIPPHMDEGNVQYHMIRILSDFCLKCNTYKMTLYHVHTVYTSCIKTVNGIVESWLTV